MRGLEIVMRTGNGQPGGPYPYSLIAGGIEAYVHQATVDVDAKLTALGIPHFFQDYGPGDHSWPYWQRDLAQTLPQIEATFAHPPAPPAKVAFTAAEPTYGVYGWTVQINRQAREFSTLSGAGTNGFSLSGSGIATVTTPARFRPGSPHILTIIASGGRRTTKLVRAGRNGRIVVALVLGPSNTQDEYLPGSTTALYTSTVAIASPDRRRRRVRPRSSRTARAAPSS